MTDTGSVTSESTTVLQSSPKLSARKKAFLILIVVAIIIATRDFIIDNVPDIPQINDTFKAARDLMTSFSNFIQALLAFAIGILVIVVFLPSSKKAP